MDDPARTPSARLLRELETSGDSFFELALRMSTIHRDYFRSLPAPNDGRLKEFGAEARESQVRQAALEATQSGSFEEYLASYFARA